MPGFSRHVIASLTFLGRYTHNDTANYDNQHRNTLSKLHRYHQNIDSGAELRSNKAVLLYGKEKYFHALYITVERACGIKLTRMTSIGIQGGVLNALHAKKERLFSKDKKLPAKYTNKILTMCTIIANNLLLWSIDP